MSNNKPEKSEENRAPRKPKKDVASKPRTLDDVIRERKQKGVK